MCRPALGYQFGTAWDESENDGTPTDNIYLDDQHDRGVNFRNVYIRWNKFENIGDNVWDTDYINRKKAEIVAYEQAGFDVIIRINFFPVPEWYFFAYPQSRFKNQYDVEWKPEERGWNDDERDTSAVSIWNNAVTNPYQAQLDDYLSQVFSELGTDFWAVYLSCGQYGEVSYPILVAADGDTRGADFLGNTNCYWAWDVNARASLAATYVADPRLTDIQNFKPGLPGGKDPYAGERLVNGGFEDTDYLDLLGSDQPRAIANWRHSAQIASDKPGSWQPEIQSTDSQSGNQHLRLNGQGGNQYYLRQRVPVVGGRPYTFEGYMKVSNTSQGMLRIQQLNASDAVVDTLVLFSTAESWTHVYQSITMNASTIRANIDVYLDTGSTLVEYDSISLHDAQVTDHYAAEKFLAWYYTSLADYINWLIPTVRMYYPAGRLFLMGGGFSSMAGDIEDEIQQDIMGNSKNNHWVQRGAAPDRYLTGILPGNRTNLYFLNTALEQIDQGNGETAWETGPLYTDFSAPHYFAKLADIFGLRKFGENAGNNDYWEMSRAFQNMQDYAYEGLAWAKPYELYQPYLNRASLKDYAEFITAYGGPAAKQPTGGSILPIVTGWEGDAEPRGYDNVYNWITDVESYNTAEYSMPLCTRAQPDFNQYNPVTPYADSQYYLLVAGKVTSGATSPNCYYWLFNDVLIPYHDITIQSGTKLSYWIYPYDDSGDATDGNRCVAIDLIFSNGSALRNHPELTDQNGHHSHPAQRHDHLVPNTWNYVEIDLSAMAGQTIQQVWAVFDDPNYLSHGEKYRVYIDDLRFADPLKATPTVTPTPVHKYPLGAAVPNPFLPTLGQTLDFGVDAYYSAGTAYQIKIFNLNGKLIKILDNAGQWDGRNQNGRYCEGGVYFYQIKIENRTIHGKVVVLK